MYVNVCYLYLYLRSFYVKLLHSMKYLLSRSHVYLHFHHFLIFQRFHHQHHAQLHL